MTAAPTSLRGFPARIGQLVVAPRAGVARVEAEGGGLTDALWLVVLGVLTFRLPELVRVVLAAAGPSSGELMRLCGLFVDELKSAAWVVLPAAVIITVAAGGRRDASRDLDLGAACYAPYFTLRAVARLVEGVMGFQLLPEALVDLFSGIGAVFVLAYAIRAARTRGNHTPGMVAATEPDRRGLLAGLGVLALSAAALGVNAVWIARNYDSLRPIRRGEPAPAFVLPDIDHADTVSLEKLRGQVVVLDFWATWCSPCVAMLPVMDALHGRWGARGVAFLGINSDGGGATLDEIKSFLASHHIPYPVAVDDGTVGALYKVEALPSLIVIGRDGRIRQSFVGYTSERALDRALADATRD
ncbi:MAG TPA: TlpA disulfide reductase family protein [Polyangia bacterium]|jgi:thiol-disulfide isomerase/thioredoxin|nr:TlpA disulfide reductase family protein [Polyangia bacterium]